MFSCLFKSLFFTNIDEASSNLTEISNDYDTDYIKYNLRKFGHQPGPIVATTKQLYLRKLNRIKRNPELNANDNNININSGNFKNTVTCL